MSQQNKAIMRRFIEEAWNKGKLAVVDELTATNYVFRTPSDPEVKGLEGSKQFINRYRTAFPDLHFTIEDQIAEGDKVVTRWTARGTHNGELKGIRPTGKQITTTGITISRIVDGKTVEAWANWDTLGMMQQLGVVPTPERAAR